MLTTPPPARRKTILSIVCTTVRRSTVTACLATGLATGLAGPLCGQQWRPLFNGQDLKGWTPKITGFELGENHGNTFRVEDGILKVGYDRYDQFDGRFGHLFYNGEFSNYRLRIEYRFVGKQIKGGPGWAFRNSGVMVHGQSATSMGKHQKFPVSIEVQLLGGRARGKRSTANLCTPGTHVVMRGKLHKQHCTNSSSATYRGEQWVQAEIVVNGDRIVHFVAGEKVLEYTEPQLDDGDQDAKRLLAQGSPKMLRRGSISLQSESHPVEFRKVEILELPDPTKRPGKSGRSDSSAVHDRTPIKVPAGFVATTVYDVPKDQGSWVSLTVADQGRLIACNQYGKLFRITLAGTGADLGTRATVRPLATSVGHAQGLLYAFDSLYVMGKDHLRNKKDDRNKNGANKKGDQRSGLFRLTDTTGDDQYDKVEHLLQLRVGGEHHGHAIVLGPDGQSIYICAGNMAGLPTPGFQTSRMPRIWRGDHIIPRMPDARGHNTGAKPIGGWVARLSPDGKECELISNGYRNEYDIAFNPAGELFTFDADMEWDIGAAWYRPTRICHVVSGSEFGWRYGTGKWPAYAADSLDGVVDIGPGSPTGIVFGTDAHFPAKYQKALFVCDWSYGIIYAVHLQPAGASYTATKEAFATAAPLPLTDIVVHPTDGAMYFIVGGRGAGSKLFRIAYRGEESTTRVIRGPDRGASLRALRHRLEALHRPADGAVATAWSYLGHPDRHIRFAARLAIENQTTATWQSRVLEESHPRRLVHGVIALARHGAPTLRTDLLRKLNSVEWQDLATEQKLELLRAYALVLARMPAADAAADDTDAKVANAVIEKLDRVFPDRHSDVNRELCRILCHLDAENVVAKTLRLQAAVPTQEEQMHYAYCLRVVQNGWTTALRQQYLRWFHKALTYRGGASFLGFCNNIRSDAIRRMPATARATLGTLVTEPPKPRRVLSTDPERQFVKMWTVAELAKVLEQKTSGHDFARGRRMFGVAACARCHRFGGEGGAVGPDLTGLGSRFSNREILEAIIEPSKVISDQYQATVFELTDGKLVVGYIANYAGGNAKIVENMFDPNKFTNVKVADIQSKSPSPVSTMPPNLLMVLTAREIQDLLAYLRSGGDPTHRLFK